MMYRFEIVTQDKYMKKAIKIAAPHTRMIGKIDFNDFLNSSLPNEIGLIGEKGIERLKAGKK